MCDCVPSTLTAYGKFRTRKLGLNTCDLNQNLPLHMVSINSYPFPNRRDAKCVRNGCSRLYESRFELVASKVNVSTAVNRVASCRSLSAFGSSGFEFGTELGFKEGEGDEYIEFGKREADEKFGKFVKRNEVNVNNGSSEEGRLSNYDDVVEVKGAAQKKKRDKKEKGSLEREDSIGLENWNGYALKDEGVRQVKRRMELRSGRQLMKRANILAKQVISIQSALSLGFISELWVDTSNWVVLIVEVRQNLLASESDKVLLEDIKQVGDVVLIQDEGVMADELRMVGLENLVGYDVVTPGRRSIGKVRGFTFNINSGVVESLELDAFGISIIPSNLVSTYALFIEDVLEVVSDTVVVHEAAASRIQRLTKGLLGSQYMGRSMSELQYSSDVEHDPLRPDEGSKLPRSSRRRKFNPRKREILDHWELPMDYL
ncbi:hypothetical protein Ancab_031381 [Ancistrocladus abbreviatus]